MKYFIFTLIVLSVGSCASQGKQTEVLKDFPESQEIVQPIAPILDNDSQSQENNF